MTATTRPRVAYLDGLRGVAILTVIAVHWRHGLPFFTGGGIGVDVFFVISGYLITGILIRRAPTYREFMFARARRLLPALAGVLAGGILLYLLLPSPPADTRDLMLAALYTGLQLTSIVRAASEFAATPWSVSWSLSAEWIFYALWPFAISAIRRLRWGYRAARNRLLVAAAILYAFTLLLPPAWAYFGPTGRFAELAVGGALAYHQLSHSGREFQRRFDGLVWVLGALVVLWVLFGASGLDAGYRLIGLPLAVAWTSCVILQAMAEPDSLLIRLLSTRWLAGIGLMSYSIYLWHYLPIAVLDADKFGLPAPVGLVIALVLITAVSLASYRWLEKPFTKPRPNPASPSARTVQLPEGVATPLPRRSDVRR